MASDTVETGGLLGAASAIVIALWAALRAAGAESRAELRRARDGAEARAAAAETRALYWERKSWELAGEIKAAAARRRGTSVPPSRDEMPTLDAILDLRGVDAVAGDQRARQREIDDVLRAGIRDLPSIAPPLEGVRPKPPRRTPPR